MLLFLQHFSIQNTCPFNIQHFYTTSLILPTAIFSSLFAEQIFVRLEILVCAFHNDRFNNVGHTVTISSLYYLFDFFLLCFVNLVSIRSKSCLDLARRLLLLTAVFHIATKVKHLLTYNLRPEISEPDIVQLLNGLLNA